MALFVQLLIPSIVHYVVIYTNCNTILSIYLPIILSIVLLRRNDEDNDGENVGSVNTTTCITDTSITTRNINDKTKDTIETSTASNSSGITAHRKSQRIRSQQRSQKENEVNGGNDKGSPLTKKDIKNVASKSEMTSRRTNCNRHDEMDDPSSKRTSTTTTTTNTNVTIRQLLLQYWIITRMVSCVYTIATHSIPYWIRHFVFFVLGISSLTTNRIYAHFEFYLYLSVYIIPMITPSVVLQEMISTTTNHTPISTTGTVTTETISTSVPSSTKSTTKNHSVHPSDSRTGNNGSTTLIQVYYVQYKIGRAHV